MLHQETQCPEHMWLKRPLHSQISCVGESLGNNLNVLRQWGGILGVTGKLCHITSAHYSCLIFIFPALAIKKERKRLKIPAHPSKQPTQREFPLHKRSRRTDRGPRAAWWRYPTMQLSDLCSAGVRGSPRGQMERSHVETIPRLARILSYAPALRPPLGSEVHTSLCR